MTASSGQKHRCSLQQRERSTSGMPKQTGLHGVSLPFIGMIQSGSQLPASERRNQYPKPSSSADSTYPASSKLASPSRRSSYTGTVTFGVSTLSMVPSGTTPRSSSARCSSSAPSNPVSAMKSSNSSSRDETLPSDTTRKQWLRKLEEMEDELAHRYPQWRTISDANRIRQDDLLSQQAVPFSTSRATEEGE